MLTLNQMTPEQKLGRVLCARGLGNEENIAFTLELVKNQACGCLQIPFGSHTAELIKLFRDAADYPLLIVNDMERGFPLSTLPKIPLISLAACSDPEYVRVFAAALAKEAREMGFSGCWGPIVDILHRDGPCSVSRKSGDSAETVTHFAREIQRVFATYHFHGTGKHYPGADNGGVDTHMVEGVSQMTREDLMEKTLVPYLELMKDGLLPAIMTGHQVVKSIDPVYPASLSKKVIGIIREAGFDGVIYTDSLAMMGILQKFGEENAMWMALMAGNDIILPNYRTPMKDVYEMMLRAYREGKITDERLDEAVRRVMALEAYCAAEPENPYPVPENAEEILNNIARDCITAECAEGLTPAIDADKARMFAVVTPQEFREDDPGEEITMRGWYHPHRVIDAVRANFPQAEIRTIREFPTPGENEKLLNAATKYDEVVFITFCTTAAYAGTDGLTRRMESVINALAASDKVSAVVHFGNPLALKNLLPVPRKIFGYTAPESQPYAIDVLAGKLPARGKNPFPNVSAREARQ